MLSAGCLLTAENLLNLGRVEKRTLFQASIISIEGLAPTPPKKANGRPLHFWGLQRFRAIVVKIKITVSFSFMVLWLSKQHMQLVVCSLSCMQEIYLLFHPICLKIGDWTSKIQIFNVYLTVNVFIEKVEPNISEKRLKIETTKLIICGGCFPKSFPAWWTRGLHMR